MSLSSLLSATETAARLSDAAVTAAEEAKTAADKALTAAKLARAEALTAVRIASDLQEKDRSKRELEGNEAQGRDTIIRLRNQLRHLADDDNKESERKKVEEAEDLRNKHLVNEENRDRDDDESECSESEQSVSSSDADADSKDADADGDGGWERK